MESFNGKLRDELLNRELFLGLEEARVVLDAWRLDYNHRRPHSSLKWQTPAAYAATLDDSKAGVFPAASDADPPVGATPLPPAQHPIKPPPILSKQVDQRSRGGHACYAINRRACALPSFGKLHRGIKLGVGTIAMNNFTIHSMPPFLVSSRCPAGSPYSEPIQKTTSDR